MSECVARHLITAREREQNYMEGVWWGRGRWGEERIYNGTDYSKGRSGWGRDIGNMKFDKGIYFAEA